MAAHTTRFERSLAFFMLSTCGPLLQVKFVELWEFAICLSPASRMKKEAIADSDPLMSTSLSRGRAAIAKIKLLSRRPRDESLEDMHRYSPIEFPACR